MSPFFNTYKNEKGQKKLLKSREEGMAHVHVGSIGWINRLYFILDRTDYFILDKIYLQSWMHLATADGMVHKG